jgi:hypothetical protein
MITVQLTNGFGNNIFQYMAAKLLAEYHGQQVGAVLPTNDYYAINDLKKMNINITDVVSKNAVPINEFNYKAAYDKRYSKNDFHLAGYFEDYTFFIDKINLIKKWYPIKQKRNEDDLVLHFRAGDRLYLKNGFEYKPSVQSYINAIEKFNFKNLYIVTDMPKWDYITPDSLEQMKFHADVPRSERVPIEKSVNYFNSFVDGLSKYDPIINGKEKRSIYEDFNFMRSFDNIMFQHGTLGWWASIMSNASKVGVYGPWRPWKGDRNKNLSKIPLEGWFQWD